MIPARHIFNLSKTIKTPTSSSVLKYNNFKFPGGENHIVINDELRTNKVTVISSMKNSDDVMSLLLATDALKRMNSDVKINLFLPYFPYARQDRVMNKGEPLSINVMTKLINSLKCDKVTIYDPHSDVTSALLNNVTVVNNHKFVARAINEIMTPISSDDFYIHSDAFCIVSPDAGAQKKIYDVCKYLDYVKDSGIILGSKNRNVKTGKITSTDFVGDVKGKFCIIIDDIIDGGATFIELSKILKQRGASKVFLVVSHGIFSKGLEPLKSVIDGIYTTDSITSNDSWNDNYIHVMNLIDCNKEILA
jgi:ribose-phosphate pyrophosphokinase